MKKAKKTAKAVAKKKAAPVREVRTAVIGGHEVEVPEAAPSVYDRVIRILDDGEDAEALTSEEIAGRIPGDWTPAELEGALRHGVDVGTIARAEGGFDGMPTLYSLAATAAPPPIDEAAVLAEARAELDRVLAREDRPRATRLLECRLTDAEKAAKRLRSEELRGQEVAELREVERLAGLLKAAKERAAALASLKDHEQDVARGGVEHRDVECQEVVLWARGVALTFRADTGEEIERRTLEAADERQGALFPGSP